jgi:hypothetical protein
MDYAHNRFRKTLSIVSSADLYIPDCVPEDLLWSVSWIAVFRLLYPVYSHFENDMKLMDTIFSIVKFVSQF